MAAVVRCLLPANSKQVGSKSKFGPIFDESSLNFENFSLNSGHKTWIKQFNFALSLGIKSIILKLTISAEFGEIYENLVKNANKNSWNTSIIHKTLNLASSL